MLKRPSSRRKSSKEVIELNLVPILDAMVTLIAFLLFTSSFLSIVAIETPAPAAGKEENAKILKEKPLQLTVSLRERDTAIWSPFDKIKPRTIPHLTPGQPDLKAIHEALLDVKQKFPQETKVVLVPEPGMTYDTLISVMDAVRTIETGDPPIYRVNPATGTTEALKGLFPEVIFGNLLGDG